MANLLGEPFKEYVNSQINLRQKVHGKSNRDIKDIQYLNSKNAWIKLASGTSFGEDRLFLLAKNGNPLLQGVIPGHDLAIKNVLFNGLTSFGDVKHNIKDTKISGGGISRTESWDTNTNQIQRAGISGANRAYGVGGTQQYGYSPMPGILDADVKDLNRGSIKKATINIKAHNRNQFDVIDALYLRLGYTILLEWGVDKYLSTSEDGINYTLEDMGTTLADGQFFKWNDSSYREVLPTIENLRKKYKGNYDGMFGVISNFSWTFEADGSYNIKLEIISQGDVIESLKADLPPSENSGEDPENTNTTSVNEYSKASLASIATEALTNEDTFYLELYPGLKEIIEAWYKIAIEGKAQFDTTTRGYAMPRIGISFDSQTGRNFPKLDVSSYRTQNKDASEINIQQAEYLDNAFDNIMNNALVKWTRDQYSSTSKYFTSVNYLGDKELLKHWPQWKGGIKTEWGGWSLSGFNLRTTEISSNSYVDYSLEESYRLYAKLNGIADWEDMTNEQMTHIERMWLIRNINLSRILTMTFEYYRDELNYAGGTKDPQFADQQTPEEETEEQTAAKEEKKSQEARKDKNKVFDYLYDIKTVWEKGNINLQDLYGLNKERIGEIINPQGDDATAKAKTYWNKKVNFPIYPQNFNPNSVDVVRLNIQPLSKQYFIRLGTFLEYLEKHVIPKISTGKDEDPPMLLIDYHPENNICYVIDQSISLDINKTIVRNKGFYIGKDYENIYSNLNKFIYSVDGFLYGNIMNIYLNFARIEELFENVDDQNQVSIFSILKNLATDINESLGNLNNIEPVINKEKNIVTFIDQTSIPGLESISKTLEGYKEFTTPNTTLEIYGYNNSKPGEVTSNFVRNIGITTEISKEYATMITIGATANGAIPGKASTAFSQWNIDINDRFKTNIIDGEAKRNANLKKQNELVLKKYGDMLGRNNGILGLDKEGENNFTINDDTISLNKDVASNYYYYAQAETSNQNHDSIESSIGFIPFNLKIEMDGLSGIKIYNKVKVNTSFLPTNYGETLDFIVTGVNHKLSGNEWVTNLDTIATTKDKFSK